jgi:hypothetical protein
VHLKKGETEPIEGLDITKYYTAEADDRQRLSWSGFAALAGLRSEAFWGVSLAATTHDHAGTKNCQERTGQTVQTFWGLEGFDQRPPGFGSQFAIKAL